MALLSGIEETKILEIKKEEIHGKASQSIKEKGWLPNLFRSIIGRAKDLLQNLIREKAMPPKPTLDIDIHEFRHMRTLMIGYTSALKAPVRCFGNHLSGKRKSWFRTDNDCGGAAILKTRTSRMGTPVGC